MTGDAPAEVVVIDDDDDYLEFMVELLRRNGHATLGFSEARIALEHIERSPPRLVITDVFMPEIDGVETLLHIRKRHPKIRVVAMSGGARRADLDFLAPMRSLGAEVALSKWLDPTELLAALSTFLT